MTVADSIVTISPSTNQPVVERTGASIQDARAVVEASKAAFQSYKQLPLAERKSIVTRAMKLLDERKHELSEQLTAQMGRPIAYTTKEIDTMQLRANYLLDMCEEALADIPGRAEAGFRRHVAKEATGPTLIVFAWNYPYLIIVNSLVPALLAGNSVMLKPSPQTPTVGESLVEIFQSAGLPKNVLQVVQSGSPEVLSGIVKIPDIRLITFTGSTAGGLALRAAAAERIVPISLELGGNDPAYVRPDADLAYVAAQLVDGAVFNSGQSCCSIERIYVHADVHDQFVKEVQKELAGYKLGDPMDKSTNVGPVISRHAIDTINAHVQDALTKGAKDATPSNASFKNPPANGNYVAPTVLIDLDHGMRVMREETFGPVVPIMKVSSDEEAVRLMNDSDYGLTASVWTSDVAKGGELIKHIEAGTVFVNRCDYPNPDLAWTGWKNSGLGCTLGPHGFDAFCRLKSYHVKEVQA